MTSQTTPALRDREGMKATTRNDRRGHGSKLIAVASGIPDAVWTFAVIALILAALEAGVSSGVVSDFVIAKPSDVAQTLWSGFREGTYLNHTASTIGAAAVGFSVSFVLATFIGGALASIRRVERIFYPIIVAFQSLPKVAVAPVIVLVAGFGYSSKILIVAIVCFFPLLVNTMQGLKIRDRDQYELFVSLGASRMQMFRHLRVPGAMPFVFAGVRVASIFALIGAIVAEFVGSQSGLGVVMMFEKNAFNVPGVYAILVLLMAIGIVINLVTARLERRFAFWSVDNSHAKEQ